MTMAWEDVPIGIETGRLEFTVTDEMIDDYLSMMDLDMNWFTAGAAPYGKRIAPPDMIPKTAMETIYQDFLNREIGTNIRAKQAFQFFAPVPVGTVVLAVGHLVEKYERRERRFVTLEGRFTDPTGKQLMLDRRTQLVLEKNFNIRKK